MFGRKSARVAEVPAIPSISKNEAPEGKATQTSATRQMPTPKHNVGASSPDEAQRRAIAVARMSVAFAQIVSVLMRSASHKHFALTDLEWFVVPPLLVGQWSIANAKPQQEGPEIPVALALWASVSPEVDKRLSENPNAPIRLRPDEWKSGTILWLIEAVGDPRVVPSLLKELNEKTFKDRQVKMRVRGEDGKPAIRALADALARTK